MLEEEKAALLVPLRDGRIAYRVFRYDSLVPNFMMLQPYMHGTRQWETYSISSEGLKDSANPQLQNYRIVLEKEKITNPNKRENQPFEFAKERFTFEVSIPAADAESRDNLKVSIISKSVIFSSAE